MDLQKGLLKRIPDATEGVWSSSGKFIVYQETNSAQHYVVADDNGNLIETLSGVAGGTAWSLSADMLAYSVSSDEIGIYDPQTKTERTLSIAGGWNVPIYWILDDTDLLVGNRPGVVGARVGVGSGQVIPWVPLSSLWISPTGDRAVLVTLTPSSSIELAIVDLRDMTMSLIDESVGTLVLTRES